MQGFTDLCFMIQYVGNMHGDEPLGRELVLLLSDWLCDNYKKDPMVYFFFSVDVVVYN